MKKIISMMVALTMLFSSFAATAKVPEFFKDTYNNYTMDYVSTLRLTGADELKDLIYESGFPEEAANYVDITACIDSLFDAVTRVNIQCDVSDDYKKIDLAITTDSKQNVTVNQNLNANVNYKSGLWVHFDIASETPDIKIVYITPVHDKYQVVDVMKYVEENDIEKFTETFEKILNSGFIQFFSDEGIALLEKYADIRESGNTCTVRITNDGLIGMINECCADMVKMAESDEFDFPEEFTEIFEVYKEVKIPEGIKVLGADGIKCVYELNNQKKITKCKTAIDVEFSISDIYTQITGMEWEYTKPGKIGIDINLDMDVTRLGKTTPDFPVLTEENSSACKLAESIFESYNDYYVNEYIYIDEAKISEFDGAMYFPMEELLKKSYGKEVETEVSGNTVTAVCPYFADITYVTVSVGNKIAITDNAEYDIGEVRKIDGKVYVTEKFFEDVLGWTLDNYNVDFLNDTVSYTFTNYTMYEDDYFDDDFDDDYLDDEAEYPYMYAWGSYDGLVKENDVYYVPLRNVLESAYDSTVKISYKNGKVTAECEHFDKFKKMSLTIGKSTVKLDGTEYSIDKVIAEDGVTYVGAGFFEDIFGWKLESFRHDRINNYTEAEYVTSIKE